MYVFTALEPVALQTTGELALGAFIVAALAVTVLITVFITFSPYLSGDPSVHAPSVDDDHAGEFGSDASADATARSSHEDVTEGTSEARTE